MNLLRDTLRGLGQIVLQPSAPAGLLLVLGMALASVPAALAAATGSMLGTLVAHALRFPATDRDSGYYGFNGALFAIGMAVFYPLTSSHMVLAGAGAVAVTLLLRAMQMLRLPAYTLPFISSLWLVFMLLPRGPMPPSTHWVLGWFWADAWLQGFSQVTFLANAASGVLLLLAIAVHSVRCAALSAVATVLALLLGAALGWPTDAMGTGLYGYNAILASIATALFWPGAAGALVAALLATLILHGMLVAGLPALTFPFVLATWIMLAYRRLRPRAIRTMAATPD